MSVQHYAVFYCRYRDNRSQEEPTEMTTQSIRALAFDILESADDYFGIVDSAGMTLQIMVEAQGYWTEIPKPSKGGSYGARLTQEALTALLDDLPPFFDASCIPGATFTAW